PTVTTELDVEPDHNPVVAPPETPATIVTIAPKETLPSPEQQTADVAPPPAIASPPAVAPPAITPPPLRPAIRPAEPPPNEFPKAVSIVLPQAKPPPSPAQRLQLQGQDYDRAEKCLAQAIYF